MTPAINRELWRDYVSFLTGRERTIESVDMECTLLLVDSLKPSEVIALAEQIYGSIHSYD